MARPAVRQYIRRAFDRQARAQKLRYLVEKTCANSLRVAFVDQIVPEAKYIFLVRDGRDVTVSAMKRWTAPFEGGYIARKARFVPTTDVPYYALRYFGNRLHRAFNTERRLASWGPRFEGMDQMLRTRTLAEVCAAQWARSVRISSYELARIEAERVCRVKYEDFVAQPVRELSRLLDFLEIDSTGIELAELVGKVNADSRGSWRRQLPRPVVQTIEPLMRRELQQFGYEPAAAAETSTIPFPLEMPLRRAA
jgi:hypothetical protein